VVLFFCHRGRYCEHSGGSSIPGALEDNFEAVVSTPAFFKSAVRGDFLFWDSEERRNISSNVEEPIRIRKL